VGGYPIVASGAADANYAISFVEGALTIGRASLLITAENKSKVYGQANPALSASYSGFVNGETAADLDAPVSLSTTATASSPVGSYPIVAFGAVDSNYEIDFAEGVLLVELNAEIQSITLDFDGRVRILFIGVSGRLYRVEGSNDLLTWGTLGTAQPDPNGMGEFVHARSSSENFSAHFYRLVWP